MHIIIEIILCNNNNIFYDDNYNNKICDEDDDTTTRRVMIYIIVFLAVSRVRLLPYARAVYFQSLDQIDSLCTFEPYTNEGESFIHCVASARG